MLLPPLEVTHGRLQEGGRILEPPKTPIAVVAKKAAGSSCTMVVVDRQSARPPTTAPVSLPNPTDGAPAVLLVEQGLILLGGKTAPACLNGLIAQGKTGTTVVLAVTEGRKLLADLLQPAALAHRHTLADMSVFDPVKTLLGQVGSH